jgi:hypothetical protein
MCMSVAVIGRPKAGETDTAAAEAARKVVNVFSMAAS